VRRVWLEQNESYEVLGFANLSFSDNTTIVSLHRFETLIKEKFPSHICNENRNY